MSQNGTERSCDFRSAGRKAMYWILMGVFIGRGGIIKKFIELYELHISYIRFLLKLIPTKIDSV